MKTKKYFSSASLILSAFATIVAPVASANFYVDYQGMNTNAMSQEELRRLKGAPDGYRVLTDKTFGVVHQVGKGDVSITSSFGAAMTLKDAITMLMPAKWIAYIDENIDSPGKVDWQANNEPWIDVLGKVGSNYGYRFVVDWDQKLLQITADEDYLAPDYNDPITLRDPESGRTIFVYSAKPVNEGGVIVVDGKVIPVKLVK